MPSLSITEVDRPHCDHCGLYSKPGTKGKAIKFWIKVIILCDSCYAQLVSYIVRLEKSNLETGDKKDDDNIS